MLKLKKNITVQYQLIKMRIKEENKPINTPKFMYFIFNEIKAENRPFFSLVLLLIPLDEMFIAQ